MSQLLLLNNGAPGGASLELFRSLNYPDSWESDNCPRRIVWGAPRTRLLFWIILLYLLCSVPWEVYSFCPLRLSFFSCSHLACGLGNCSNGTSSLPSFGCRFCCSCCWGFRNGLPVCLLQVYDLESIHVNVLLGGVSNGGSLGIEDGGSRCR